MKKIQSYLLAVIFIGVFAVCAGAKNAPAAQTGAGNSAAAVFAEVETESDAAGVVAQPADKWIVMPRKGASGGTVLYSETPGATLEYDFNGAAISADVIVGKMSGMISVKVDDKPVATIDLYRNILDQGVERIELANNLAPGAHKLRIEELSDKNPKGLSTRVVVDTLRVANVPYGTISGVIECRYNAGLPVMRARVSAISKDGEHDIVTGATGAFSVEALAPGAYALRFEHPGYATQELKDLAVAAGRKLVLPKILLEENAGARPLTYIRYPLGTRPVIVRPGDDFTVEVAAPASATGWQVVLESPLANGAAVLKNASFNTDKGRWTLAVTAPAGAAALLYGIRLKFAGGEDFQPRAVMVVPAFKDSIRVVHLTDVHVYKNEQAFDIYRNLADEINLINPDVVVVTGDLTDSNGYTDDRWPESDQYPPMLDLWNSYNEPTFIITGNHDVSPLNKEDDKARWLSFFDTTDFSFDVGAYHFTAFNDAFTMVSMISPGEKRAYRDDLFPEQFEWIGKDLAAHTDAKMRILLYHVPLHTVNSKIIDVAAENNVKLALYGHVHMNQIDKVKGTTYVQTASTYDGAYRVLNLNDGKIGEINGKKDGYSSFSIGTLTTDVQNAPDGNSVTVKVKNISPMKFPGATWRADMPSAADYVCDGCAIVARYANGAKTLVQFTFDVPAKGETTVTLSAK
jgi:predicted MPP superfamily phosphohydrolase